MADTQKWFYLISVIVIAAFIYVLSPVLTPFVIAALLAYLANPLVTFFERFKFPRTIAVVVVFVILFLLLLLLLLLLIPLLEKQMRLLIVKLPDIVAWFEQVVLPWLSTHFGIKDLLNAQHVKALVSEHWQTAGGVVGQILKTISHSGMALVAWLMNLILIPVVGFYLMRDWNKLLNNIRKLLPRHIEPMVVNGVLECHAVLGAFFRGQLLVMLGLGIIYSLGLSLVGLDVALLIGFIAGLVSIVPYLGFIVGIVSALVAALFQFHDAIYLLYVAIVFGVGQLAESMVLTPLLVGDQIGLHPVAVIFAILVGGQLFGFFGVLLALPVAAILMVWLRHMKQSYVASNLYQTA